MCIYKTILIVYKIIFSNEKNYFININNDVEITRAIFATPDCPTGFANSNGLK